MATSTLNIRLDSDLKRELEEVSSDIGLTPTAGFPFAVTAPVPTEREFAAKMDTIYLSMLEGNASEHELVEA